MANSFRNLQWTCLLLSTLTGREFLEFLIPRLRSHLGMSTPISFLQVTMGFAYSYLHYDGAFILFYPDSPMVRKEISSFFKNYKMKVLDEWTIINYLHLANPLLPAINVCFLSFSLSYYFN
jgi:hypothetical protein